MTKFTVQEAMRRALELALLGPAHGVNPQVGAVILSGDGQVLGEGYHMGAGTKHAEVVALEQAQKLGPLPAGSVAVVTLEPCNHTGKTGPCAKALIDAGVSKVVFATKDPGEISGGGAKTLLDAGVEVIAGELEQEANYQLRVWLTYATYKRPFVTLKWAASLDGRAAANDGTSKWISGEQSRIDAHQRRSQVDAILVGTGTARADNPELTARKPDGSFFEHQPLRVILGETELGPELRLFNSDAKTIQLKTKSVHGALSELYEQGVKHLMVEGGPTVASKFIQLDLVDEYVLYLAPKLLGGEKLAIGSIDVATIAEAKNLSFDEVSRLGDDILIVASRKAA